MRIAVGSFVHEANTFTPARSEWEQIETHAFACDADVVRCADRFDTAIPGFLTLGAAPEVEWLGLVSAGLPGGAGMLTAAAFERLRAEIVNRVAAAGRLDACLLSLGGGSVVDADGGEDGDGLLLAAVREALPPGCVLGVALDMHANLSERAVAAADVMLAYQTFPPHWDKREIGARIARIAVAARRGEAAPVMALAKPPMLLQPEGQDTRRAPMRDLLALAAARESGRVLAVSLLPGFAWSDVPDVGASVLVVADGDGELARRTASELAAAWFARRAAFDVPLVAVDDAAALAAANPEPPPLLLCDPADNVGAGGAGDSTELLGRLLAHGAAGVAYGVVCDPEAVARCIAAGAGARVELALGGRRDAVHGRPLEVRARVARIAGGDYRHRGPLWPGARGALGRAVVLEIGGVEAIVAERPNGAFDPAVFTSLGIDPFARRALVVRSSVFAPRAFEGRVVGVVVVDGAGWATSNFRRLPYRRARRPLYPLDGDAAYGDATAPPARGRTGRASTGGGP